MVESWLRRDKKHSTKRSETEFLSCPVDWERVFAHDNADDVANASLCNTIVLDGRKMETIFGPKFETFSLIYFALWLAKTIIINQKIINYQIRARNFLLHMHFNYLTKSSTHKDVETCRFAYRSYKKILKQIRNFLRGQVYHNGVFLGEVRINDDLVVADSCASPYVHVKALWKGGNVEK